MKILIVALLLLVVASLFSGLYFMYRDKSGTRRTVNALTLRIALSVFTFLLIMAGFYFGWLPGK
ncbi:MAG: twin transmembrane helix small protein [Betaproteobacteria bacterium]|nr:twin transmembrane helix small protein [Betaproteobacteria bacterium]